MFMFMTKKQKKLFMYYPSIGLAVKDLHVSNETIKKYIDTNIPYKGKFFYSSPLDEVV